jgi:hypothetical protein
MHFQSLSTKKMWGGLQEASLIVFSLFSTFFAIFIILLICRRRGVKGWRVRGECTGCATKVKMKAAEACISIPLLHRILFIKVSNPFFIGFNIWAFFSLGSNRRTRGLQVKVRVNFLHRLGMLHSCTPLMLCFDIGGVLRIAHPKNQTKHLPNDRRGLVSLPPSPSSSSRW